jgi:NADH-quinone oxidoreductase E subunit
VSARATAAAGQVASFAFTAENAAEAKRIVQRYPAGRQASAVLPLLKIAQDQHGGWLPQPALDHVAEFLAMPAIRVYEVASFYDMYNTRPVGRVQVRVCTTTPCWLCGSDEVLRACKEVLGIGVGESSADGRFFLREFECLGACANAPVLWVDDDFYEDLDYDGTRKVLAAVVRGERPEPGSVTGRKASMPRGGKTTLKLDPHRQQEVPEDHGPGDPDQEPVDKGRPDDAVKEHHEKVEREGRPADDIGEEAAEEEAVSGERGAPEPPDPEPAAEDGDGKGGSS